MSSRPHLAPSASGRRRHVLGLVATLTLTLAGTAGLGVVTDPARAAVGPPTGIAQVGQPLRLPVSCAGAAQWLRDGQPIPQATSGQYDLTAFDLGHRVSVQQFCTSSGTQTSAETSVVINTEPELPVIANLTQPNAVFPNPVVQNAQASVVGDPTDPGVDLYIGQLAADESSLVDPGTLQVTAAVQQKGQRVSPFGTTPVANAVTVSTEGAVRHLSFAPVERGNATVVVTVTGTTGKTTTYNLDYFASMATTPTSTVLQTASDASTAIAAGDGYLFVANDEDHRIRLYNANVSGLPVATFNPGQNPNAAGEGEDDYESSARVGDSVFWLGSQGNSKKGEIEVNRHVLFETTMSGSGANATLTPVGAYGGLRRDLIAWDQTHGNRYEFATATAAGQVPDGPAQFNIEGAEFAPDDTTLYLGFRSPVVGRVPGGDALIVPLTNIFDLTSGAATAATFGDPIELDLDGQSIREIRRNDAGEYLILSADAAPDASSSDAPDTPQLLWYWDGDPDTAPQRLSTVVEPDYEECYESRAGWEGIGELPASLDPGTQVRLIMDQGYDCAYSPYHATGDNILYDPTSLKDFTALTILSKARTDLVTLAGALGVQVALAGDADFDGSFGKQEAGTASVPRRITVTNTGAKEFPVGAVSLTDSTDFRLAGDTCAHRMLAVGASCTADVQFAPTTADADSRAELTIVRSIDGEKSRFALTGTSLKVLPSLPVPTIQSDAHPTAPEVGDTLTVAVPDWTPVGINLQWLRDGRAIPGATTDSHATTTADSGHALSVRMTASATGYAVQTVTSSPVDVSPRTTSVTLTMTGSGRERILTAVTGPRLPGQVTFRDGTAGSSPVLGTAPVDLSTRVVSMRVPLSPGRHQITAVFTPDDSLAGRRSVSAPVQANIEKYAVTVAPKVSVRAVDGGKLALSLALPGTSAKPTVAVTVKVAGVHAAYSVTVKKGRATLTLGSPARRLDGHQVKVTVTVPRASVSTDTTDYTISSATVARMVKIRG